MKALISLFTILLVLAAAFSSTIPLISGANEIQVAEESPPPVNTTTGLFQGRWQYSRNGRKFASFEGIRYAKKPVRFQAPEELDDWREYDATTPGAVCAQASLSDVVVSVDEDCLFLNIFVPEKLSENPVTMVYIHGGGFIFGSGSEMGPKYILDEDVILVTLNYRLGVLGFLSSGNEVVSGNMGYKDMILALKWIKKNLAAFGGDPKNVTIFGESAGAVAVQALMISPAVKGQGLFTKVIAQSGSALSPWSYTSDPESLFQGMAEKTSCHGTTAEILECLRQKDALEIVLAGNKSIIFPAVTDAKPAAGDYSVFPESMEALAAKVESLPLMIGRNEFESLVAAAVTVRSTDSWANDLNKNWRKILPESVSFADLVWKNDTVDRISDAIHSYYFHGRDIKNADEGIQFLERVISDLKFNWSVRKSAILAARAGSQVFPYLFHFNGSFSLAHLEHVFTRGPTHADDLQYLFQSLLQPEESWPDLEPGSREEKLSQNLIKLWCSFAKTGVPYLESYGPAWKPIAREDVSDTDDARINWYILDERGNSVEESEDIFGRFRFWNNVFDSSKDWTDAGALSKSLHVL